MKDVAGTMAVVYVAIVSMELAPTFQVVQDGVFAVGVHLHCICTGVCWAIVHVDMTECTVGDRR